MRLEVPHGVAQLAPLNINQFLLYQPSAALAGGTFPMILPLVSPVGVEVVAASAVVIVEDV
jgi:hypothetical protein